MSARRAVWEVARRELVERSRSRVLRISLVLLLILSVGGAVAAARLSGRTPTDDVALVGPRSVALEPSIRLQAQAAGRRVDVHRLASAKAASRAVRDGSVDVALLDGGRLVVKTSRAQPAVRVVEAAVAARGAIDRLRSSGLSEAQALGLLKPRTLPVDVLQPRKRNYDRNRALVAIGLGALLMMLAFFGQAVAQGVTEEKASRVVELLLTTVSPRRLLAGKVLGIGVLVLSLLVIPGAAALAAGRLAGGAGLPSATPETIALIVLWFVLGYAFYSVAFAAVGALVSRQEDLSTAMLPVSALLLASFYLALIVVGSNPNGTLAEIAAFVPPFAPMAVPARVILGDMNALGLAVAVALELFAIAGLIVLGARIYERAILHIGAPVGLRRALAPRPRGPGRRSTQWSDVPMRLAAIALLLAAAVIGFGHPAAIVLVVLGIVLIALVERHRHGPHRPAG